MPHNTPRTSHSRPTIIRARSHVGEAKTTRKSRGDGPANRSRHENAALIALIAMIILYIIFIFPYYSADPILYYPEGTGLP